MIDEMQVKNLALIKQASLVPAQGLTVLTGETGAGKTALLSALKLLMGCLLYTSPSPRDISGSRMPSSA